MAWIRCMNGAQAKDDNSVIFNYNGTVQSYKIPKTGVYCLECIGASGGEAYEDSNEVGQGGYSKRYILLNKDQTIYVVVGGKGNKGVSKSSTTSLYLNGGYNGGGQSQRVNTNYELFGSGGGATHMATVSGQLSSLSSNKNAILIVAGGGGGASYIGSSSITIGGHGGGEYGGNAYTDNNNKYPLGGTQTEGGYLGYDMRYATSVVKTDVYNTHGTFGKGGQGMANTHHAGGGGGYYGGGSGANYNKATNGAGGSGYIKEKTMTYNSTTYHNINAQGGNIGNGFAVITFVE